MRQRNCTGGPLVFPTLGLECEANGEIDPPDDLGVLPGFELLDPPAETPPADPPAVEQPPADAPAEAKPKTTTKRSATADNAGEA